MELTEWLEQEAGRSAWLAKQLGLTKAAVTFWKRDGVPLDRMSVVARLTGQKVTVDAMAAHAVRVREERKAA